MKRLLWIFVLLLISVRDVGAADLVPVSPEEDQNVQELLPHWTDRPSLPEGMMMDWEITKHLRSETFGVSMPDGRLHLFLQLQGNQFRLEGESVPPEHLSQVTALFNRIPNKPPLDLTEFQSLVASRFSLSNPLHPSRPYRFLRTQSGDDHLWEGRDKSAAVAARCPVGESPFCFDLPLAGWLAEAIQCVVQGPVGGSSDLQIQALPERQRLRGVSCRILEVRPRAPDQKWWKRFWIVEGEVPRLQRSLFHNGQQVLMHFDYGQASAENEDGGALLPRRVTLLKLTTAGDVEDELAAELRSVRKGSPADMAFASPPFPEGTVVADFGAGKRQIAQANGDLRDMTVEEVLIAAHQTSDLGTRLLIGLGTQRSIGEQILQWLAWPAILVPFSIGMGFYIVLNQVMARRRLKPSLSESGPASPSTLEPTETAVQE